MSETSQAYRAGFTKLLPDAWSEGRRDYTCCAQRTDDDRLCAIHGLARPIPCPDIRASGNEALAWRALGSLISRPNDGDDVIICTDAARGFVIQVGEQTFCEGSIGNTLVAALYAAIEAIGRTP